MFYKFLLKQKCPLYIFLLVVYCLKKILLKHLTHFCFDLFNCLYFFRFILSLFDKISTNL